MLLSISVDQRVLGYLGRALSLELTAVQQYSTQAQLLGAWGLAEAAERFRTESDEELKHVQRVISRMLALNTAPSASQLRPVTLGNSLLELLQHNFTFENELVQLYADASRYCAGKADHDNRLFFEELLSEERAHAAELAGWIEQLKSSSQQTHSHRATF